MGFFSKKKKVATPAQSPASSVSSTLVASQPPSSPMLKAVHTIRLRVAVDHISPESGPQEDELFYIEVDQEASIDAIREEVYDRVGRVGMSFFKTCIPWQAYYQARTYVERYHCPVDLMTSFPCYSMDDPEQLRSSFGPADWHTLGESSRSAQVQAWWPDASISSADCISILVRPSKAVPADIRPVSFLAHFAPSEGLRSRQQTQQQQHRPPTVVDVASSATVNGLKAALLRADGRQVEQLDKVVLWRVEMSEEELVVIEERGGLKGGRMPWPYPPTAAEPILLEDGTAPVSRYFPDIHSQPRMVNLSVWIHPSASTALARMIPAEAAHAPTFKYPMLFSPRPDAERRTSQTGSLPDCLSPSSPANSSDDALCQATTIHSSLRGKSRTRQRPSTAPAFSASQPGSPSSPSPAVPSFGFSSRAGLKSREPSERGSIRMAKASPLSAEPITAGMKGLGLGNQVFASSVAVTDDLHTIRSSDFQGVPLSVNIVAPLPQVAALTQDWVPIVEGAGLKPSRSVASSRSLDGLWRRAEKVAA